MQGRTRHVERTLSAEAWRGDPVCTPENTSPDGVRRVRGWEQGRGAKINRREGREGQRIIVLDSS